MKKKFAFMVMGAHYDPQKHHAEFETDKQTTYIVSVQNPDEAYAKIMELKEMGVGAIELCGAFGPEMTKKIIEMTDGDIAVGYVTHFSEQDDVFARFFGK